MWLDSFHAVAENFVLLSLTVWVEGKANFLHSILLALAGSGLLWLALACFGWIWLALLASGWRLAGSGQLSKSIGETFPDQLVLIIFYEILISLQF